MNTQETAKILAWVKANPATAIGIAVLAVLVIAAFFVRIPEPKTSTSPRAETLAPAPETVSSNEAEPERKPASTTAAPAPKSTGLTYEQATESYAGRRFQFVNCRATPGSMVVTKGTKFMLDNRDAKAHTVTVGSASYRLPATGFAIATANTVGLLNITCDGGGSAQINVTP